MKPVRTDRTPLTFRGVPDLDVGDLPCRLENGIVYSVWELTPEERIAIAEGAHVELGVMVGRLVDGFPPISLAIDTAPHELPPQRSGGHFPPEIA